MSAGLLFDSTRCIGCQACSAACKEQNDLPLPIEPATTAYTWTVVEQRAGVNVRRLCMHCLEPTCVSVCPVGALSKTPEGPVVYDSGKCIGCRYCIMACPYEARTYNDGEPGEYFAGKGLTRIEEVGSQRHTAGVVEKCTFCAHRLDEGKEPACVATCPARARIFGDLDDPNSEVSKLVAGGLAKPRLEELGTLPSVFFIE